MLFLASKIFPIERWKKLDLFLLKNRFERNSKEQPKDFLIK